jgi:integrase
MYTEYIKNKSIGKFDYISFWKAFDEFVDMRKHNTKGYVKTFITLKNRLLDFEKWSGIPTSFDYIVLNTVTFQSKFQDYLWTERKLSNNYVNKLISNLSHFLYYSHSQSYITKRPKFRYNSVVERDEKIYLYRDEVMKLFSSSTFDYEDGKKFDNNHIYIIKEELLGTNKAKYNNVRFNTNWELIKDIFLFLCSIGCRYSDISTFRIHHFNFEQENGAFSWIQNKTDKRVYVPRNDISAHIFRKYSRGKSLDQNLFPSISIQKFNKGLKLLLKELKFNRLVEYPKKIGSTVINKKGRFLWELISSHSGRRTFIKNMIDMGTMDYHTIMKMSGHSTISQFQKYISVSPHDLSKGKNLFRLSDVNKQSVEEELLSRFIKLSEKKQNTIIELIRGMDSD